MSWQIFTGLAGGIGLFLLGMELMTDGLKQSAGKSLQRILENSTKTPLRGLFSGVLITSLVQSSSAVTVATIGFVNAGLLRLEHAIRVAYGSNLGTTMTGWLVATIGLHVDLKAFALPAIGVGMLMNLLMKGGNAAAIGKVLVGFGLFFLGIDLMKGGFEGMAGSFSLAALEGGGFGNLLLFVGMGFLMTLMMQSSSASIAMTLTAAAGGMISLPSAACMVIGANVGTTSTAVLASIGATPNAKRVAAGHVIFNGVTGVVALLILPLLLGGVTWLQTSAGMAQGGVATFLALFHTIFNVLGVLLLWPFTARLVVFLQRRFVVAEEDMAQAKYLDDTILGTPSLAIKALSKELLRIQDIAMRMAQDAISTEASISPRMQSDLHALHRLADTVGLFCAKLRQADLSKEVADSLPLAMASVRYFVEVGEMAEEVDRLQSKEMAEVATDIDTVLTAMRRSAVQMLLELRQAGGDSAVQEEKAAIRVLKHQYAEVKAELLRAGTQGALSVRQMVALIEVMKTIEQQVIQSIKGQATLQQLVHGSDLAAGATKASAA